MGLQSVVFKIPNASDFVKELFNKFSVREDDDSNEFIGYIKDRFTSPRLCNEVIKGADGETSLYSFVPTDKIFVVPTDSERGQDGIFIYPENIIRM